MSTSVLYTTSVCIRIFSLPSTTSRVNLSWSVSFDWLTTVSVPFRSSGPVVETVVLRTRLWSRHLLWHIVWNLCNRLGASSCLEGMYLTGSGERFQASSMVAYSNIVTVLYITILNAEQVTWVAFRPWNSSITCLPSSCQRIWPAMQP
jgi:hypothetical protein